MDYTLSKIWFRSSNKINQVYATLYIPLGEPIGVVQIVHGMCERISRYDRFMEFLAREGFIVCGHDHIGHGASAGSKDLLGYFGKENGYKYLVSDVHRLTTIMKKHYSHLPYFLFGHSMGSFVSRLYLSKYSYELDGVILCGTGGSNPLVPVGIAACNAIIAAKGPLYRSAALDKLIFGQYNRRFAPVRTTHDWLTRDEAIVDQYLRDPYCTFLFTASGYRDLLYLSQLSNSAQWYRTLDHDLPVFLISGDMDPVGNYGEAVEELYAKMKHIGVRDVTPRLYAGARHELLNETNYLEVQEEIRAWIVSRFPQNNGDGPAAPDDTPEEPEQLEQPEQPEFPEQPE